MHHLSPYYNSYSTNTMSELLKLMAQQQRVPADLSVSPRAAAVAAAFNIDNLLARPLIPQHLSTAPYFPYLPTAQAATFNLQSQQDLLVSAAGK